MIEEFVIKTEDGREVKVRGELLEAVITPDVAEELVKSKTFAELIEKMSEQVSTMKSNGE